MPTYQNALLPNPSLQESWQKLSQKQISKGPIADRAFAHIHGDHYIQNTDLEGWQPLKAKETLEDLAQDFPKDVQEKIASFTKKIIYIDRTPMNEQGIIRFAQKIAEKTKNLQVGEDLWLEGGGNDHAMFYRFIKRPGNTYDIYIHNTGAGLEYHYSELIRPQILNEVSSVKEYVCPFVEFEGVSAQEIGLNGIIDPELFIKLISIKKSTAASEQEAVKQIYEETFGAFNHRRIVDPRTRPDFTLIAPQRSGTCSWKVLAYAAIRTLFKDPKEWELFLLKIKQDSFDRTCHESKVPFLTADAKELCLQGGRELHRDLTKFHDLFLSQEEVEASRISIQKGLEALKKEELKTPQIGEMAAISCREEKKQVPSIVFWISPPLKRDTARQIVPFSAKLLQTTNLADLQQELEKIIKFQSPYFSHDLPMQIERLVNSLPRPLELATAWKNASPEEIKNCQFLLSNILNLYAGHIAKHEGRLLSEQNTAWALLAAIHHLSGRIDKKLVENYGIYHESFANLIESKTFTNFLPKDLAFYQEILSYFKKTPAENRLFDIKALNDRPIKHDTPFLPEETLLLDIAKKTPNIEKNLREQVRVRRKEQFYVKHSISESRIERALVLRNHDLFKNEPKTLHIANLRKAAYDAQSFTYSVQNGFNAVKFPIVTEESPSNKAIATRLVQYSLDPSKIPDQSNAFEPKLISRDSGCLFTKNSGLHENKRVDDLEGVPPRLEAATCQKTLQSHLIIDHFKDNISDLSDVKNQNLFLLSLFRSFPQGMPVEEAIQDPAFIRAVFQFVNKGISLYLKGSKRPDIQTTLFFLQIVRRMKELDPKLPLLTFSEIQKLSSAKNPPERFLPDYTPEINELLKREDLTEEEEKSLHLHRILQHATKKEQLCALKREETTNNQALQEIVESWIQCTHFKFHPWHSFHSQSEAAHYIYDLAPIFENLSPEFLTDVINRLIPGKERSFTSLHQEENSSLYSLKDQENKIWSISPLHGKILRDGEEMTFGVQKDFTETAEYKRLFGLQKFKLRKEGDAFVFQNREGNKFRIFETTVHRNIVQMEWEGTWYQYATGKNLDLYKNDIEVLQEKFPKFLIADHFVFGSYDKFLFVNKKTFKVDFTAFKRQVTDRKGAFLYENASVDFKDAIERFEKRPWVIEKIDFLRNSSSCHS